MCRVFYTKQFYYNKISARKTYSKQQHALTDGLPAVIDLCASLMCILWFVHSFVLYKKYAIMDFHAFIIYKAKRNRLVEYHFLSG